MHFRQLEYLETAVRVGSLRQAALELGVSQPTLTQQIRRLEEELNLILLVRRPTGVSLTEAGASLLPHVRQALQAEHGIIQEAGALSGLHKGRLRVGVIPIAGEMFFLDAVQRFRVAYPGIEFVVVEAGSSEIREALVAGELDLGITARWDALGPPDADLQMEELSSGIYAICVPVGHRLAGNEYVTTEELAGESFVVVGKGQSLRQIFDRIAAEVKVSISYETNSSLLTRRAVDAGLGISIQSAMGPMGEPDAKLHRLVPFGEPWARASILLARRPHEQPTTAMLRFMRVLRDVAADTMGPNASHQVGP